MKKQLRFIFSLLMVYAKAQVPVMGSIVGPSTICSSPSSGSYSVSASNSPTSYTWSVMPSASVVISNPNNSATSISFPYTASNYTVFCSASNSVGVSVSSASIIITTVNNPSITFSPSAPQVCVGSSTIIIASGADTYTWSNSVIGNSITISPTVTTNYSVTGTNTLTGCVAISSVVVNVSSAPGISISSMYSTICIGQSNYLSAGTANSFTWSCSCTQTVVGLNSNVSVSPSVTTTYTVIAGFGFTPCTAKAVITVSVVSCLGVTELNKNEEFKIYPNPAKDILNIECEMLNSRNTKLEMLNSLGQLILQQEVKSLKSEINITQLAQGIYFIKVHLNNNCQTYKIIKD